MTQPPVPGAKRLAGAERTRMQKRTTCSAMLARVGRPAAEMRQRRVGHAPPPATSAQEGDLSTFGVRLGPPGAVSPSPADPDPEFGIPDGAIAVVAGGSAGPSDADPPLAGAAAASTGPDEPGPVARATDAPDRLDRAMRGRRGLGLGCALDEPAPGGCTFRKYSHTTKGWCWEGKLPKGQLFNGKNSCTRGFPGPRSEEVAKMEVAMFLQSWWATTNSD